MSFEQWGILAEIVASLATVGALVGLTLEMRKSRQIENRQVIFDTDEKWESLREERKLCHAMYWDDYEDFNQKYQFGDKKYFRAYSSVINFFEMLSETSHLGMVDRKMTVRFWGQIAVYWWELFKDIQLAKRDDRTPYASEELEWLSNEVLKKNPEFARNAQATHAERFARLREAKT